MDKERTKSLSQETKELEALIAKADISDPETCWAVYLLTQSLRRRRRELREAEGRQSI